MALVRKILEKTLTAGSNSISFTDSDIPNSLLRVYSSQASLFPISQTLSGNVLTVNYKAQSSNVGIALEIVKQGLDIVDNVTSTDTDKALSANQGKVLKDAIDTTAGNLSDLATVVNNLDIPDKITDLDDVDVTDIANGQVLAWNSTTEKFENVNQSGGGGNSWGTFTWQENTTMKSVGGEYNVTFNGFLGFYISPSSSSTEVYYTVERKNTDFRYGQCWRQSGYYSSFLVPVKSGDVIRVLNVLNVSKIFTSEYPFE